jgi:hydrogenase 3 maturation protease
MNYSDVHAVLRNQFGDDLKSPVAIVGIGNRMKGDDAAGPLVIDHIKNKIQAICIDAGVAIENYLGEISMHKPRTLVIIDAVSMDSQPGDIRLFTEDEIASGGISTHILSLSMAIDYLKAFISPTILMIGIQPERCGLDEPVSPAVETSIKILGRMLIELLPSDSNR